MQAAGDAREDQRDVGGAEANFYGEGVGEGAPADRGGQFLAVVDQLADDGEQAPGAAGFRCFGGRWGGGWWHEREQEHKWRPMSSYAHPGS